MMVELLQDGLRALQHNNRIVFSGLLALLTICAAFFFVRAYAVGLLYPAFVERAAKIHELADKARETGPSGTPNTAELSIALASLPPLGPPPVPFTLFNILHEILFAAALAALYAVLLAALGREIDRPLWKCSLPREALQRFFTVWFILTLTTFVLRDFQANANNPEAQLAIEVFLIFSLPFVIPLGACVMHHGALHWEELPAILAPLGRHFNLFLPVLLVGLFQYLLQLTLAAAVPPVTHPYAQAAALSLVNLPAAWLDLLMFAISWRICALHRDTAPASPFDED